jgi:hypothetical protein
VSHTGGRRCWQRALGVGAFAAQVGIDRWVGPKWVRVHVLGSLDVIRCSVGAAELGGLAHCGFQLFANIVDCSWHSRGFILHRGGGGWVEGVCAGHHMSRKGWLAGVFRVAWSGLSAALLAALLAASLPAMPMWDLTSTSDYEWTSDTRPWPCRGSASQCARAGLYVRLSPFLGGAGCD